MPALLFVNLTKFLASTKHTHTHTQGLDTILIQEFANSGDLFSLLVKSGAKLPERTATELVVRPLLRGIQYLHSRGVVHRDIKVCHVIKFSGCHGRAAAEG